jgi:hypothetical protein
MGYFPLGGFLTSSPAVASWAAESAGRFRPRQRQRALPQVMERDQLDQLMNGSAGTWKAAPAAISRGPNLIDVFYRGRDNHLYRLSYKRSRWRDVVDLGGGCTPMLLCHRGAEAD